MFNEPMSVRGIKRIEIEEIEKIKAKKESKSPDLIDLNAEGEDKESNEDIETSVPIMKPPPIGKGLKQ